MLVDCLRVEVDQRTWEPFKEIFEAAAEFLAKELRRLRATRAIAARIKSEFVIQLCHSQLPGVFFVSSLLLELIRPTCFGGAVTNYACRLSL